MLNPISNPIPLTAENLKLLCNGTYAVFKDDSLVETILINTVNGDGSKDNYIVGAIMGSDEIFFAEEYVKDLAAYYKEGEFKITLASNIKL